MELARWCEKTWETWTQRFALTEPHKDFTPNPNDTMLGNMPWLTRFNLQVLHIPDPPAFFISLSFLPFPSPLHYFTGEWTRLGCCCPSYSRVTQSHMTITSFISQDQGVFIAPREPADTSVISHLFYHSVLLSVITALAPSHIRLHPSIIPHRLPPLPLVTLIHSRGTS